MRGGTRSARWRAHGLRAAFHSAGSDRRGDEAGRVRSDAAGRAAGAECQDRGNHRACAAPVPGPHLRLPVHVEPPAHAPWRPGCRPAREVPAAPLPVHRDAAARGDGASRTRLGRSPALHRHPRWARGAAEAGVPPVERSQGRARRLAARMARREHLARARRAARHPVQVDRQRAASRSAAARRPCRLRRPLPPVHDPHQPAAGSRDEVAGRAYRALHADVLRDQRPRCIRPRRQAAPRC